jgi:xanthine dehydrogenase accessory factor
MQFSPSLDPLAAAADLRARGEAFVMATVVRAVAPTSAKPGDKAVLTEAGLLVGWIGGSCAEPIIRRTAETALSDGECRLVLITPNQNVPSGEDGSGRSVHRMECYSGGELEIYLEPFLPLPRLLVFGNSPVARALCDLGRVMHYAVTSIDLSDRPQMGPEIDTVRSFKALPPADAASAFAVVSTHGIFDEDSLEAALALDLPYTGFVTSKKRRDQVFASLRGRQVSEAAIARIQAPAGLDIGGRQPEEIALAVMAEIVCARRRPQAALRVEVKAMPAPALAPPDAAAGTMVKLGEKKKASCCHGAAKPSV